MRKYQQIDAYIYQCVYIIHNGKCSYFFWPPLIFFKINFFENFYQNTVRMSNSLDPDQAPHFVGPDLGPNCLQRLSEEITTT